MSSDPMKEITKFIWSMGDYAEIAKMTMPSASALVDAAGVSEGAEVLDVATGSGNVAVVAAERGAIVSGCDLTPSMVELARSRADEAGLKIAFEEGDVEDLPYDNDRFDFVLSVFGAMFGPRPDVTAAELFRVTKPGGIVGMANWVPEGLIGKQISLMTGYAPTPPASDATDWGREEIVKERFAPHSDSIEMKRELNHETYESWDAFEDWAMANMGPVIVLKQMLEPERFEELRSRLRDLYKDFNKATDSSLVVDAEYLLVVARKRA